jgi:hypothetical protein
MPVTPAGLLVPDGVVDAGPAARPDEIFILQQDPPEDWVRRLREISPISDVVSWLDFHWHTPSQRWVIYECVPIKYVDDLTLLEDLMGPDADSPEGQRAGTTVTSYQQRMYHKHRVHARPCWVIQGTKGGHQVVYGESTKELCRARGLPTEPPMPGDLPYAPFDERVVTQLIRMNKLVKVRNDLGEFKRKHGNVENWKREKREELRRARAEFVKFLDDQLTDGDDLLKSAARKGEIDNAPVDDREYVEDAELQNARYVETGHF